MREYGRGKGILGIKEIQVKIFVLMICIVLIIDYCGEYRNIVQGQIWVRLVSVLGRLDILIFNYNKLFVF